MSITMESGIRKIHEYANAVMACQEVFQKQHIVVDLIAFIQEQPNIILELERKLYFLEYDEWLGRIDYRELNNPSTRYKKYEQAILMVIQAVGSVSPDSVFTLTELDYPNYQPGKPLRQQFRVYYQYDQCFSALIAFLEHIYPGIRCIDDINQLYTVNQYLVDRNGYIIRNTHITERLFVKENEIFLVGEFNGYFEDPEYGIFGFVKQCVESPELVAHKLNVYHADNGLTGKIDERIWNSIAWSSIVIADIVFTPWKITVGSDEITKTHANFNVAYEIGIAHSLGKPVIILYDADSTWEGWQMPFDVYTHRRIAYHRGRLDEIRGELLLQIASALSEPKVSPESSVILS